MNCNSLQSTAKQIEFVELIEAHTPDIICGCESILDSTISTAEIFPDNFNVYRKDICLGGGGVFIATSKHIIGNQENQLDSDCEARWVKLNIAGTKPLYIASVYREPNSDLNPLAHLERSAGKVINSSALPNVIITHYRQFQSS